MLGTGCEPGARGDRSCKSPSFFVSKASAQTLLLRSTAERARLLIFVDGGYEDSVLAEQLIDMVEAHDPAVPLFPFWAPHIVHTPLQVPAAFYHKFNFIAPTDKVTHERQIYHAMVYAFIGLLHFLS